MVSGYSFLHWVTMGWLYAISCPLLNYPFDYEAHKSNKATKAYFLKLKIEIKNEISNDKMQTYITLKKTSQLKI